MEAPYRYSLLVKYSKGHVGFPRIVARGSDQAVVCDWTGTLSLLDLSRKSILKSENVAWVFEGQPLGCTNLTSLRVNPETGDSCVVATRGAYAAVWDLETSEVLKIETGDGPVNAVAYSPDGTRLAIGTGSYGLTSGRVVRPTIQVWDLTEGEPTRLMSATLPGQCVDTIHWDSDYDRIVCVTGDASQESGSFCCLDGETLRSICLDRIPLAVAARILAVGQSYLVGHRGGVQSYDRDDFRPGWTHLEDVDSPDLALDEEADILFFGGTTFLAWDGEEIGKSESPDGICSVSPRPEGGYLTVSKEGVVGVWSLIEDQD